MTVFDELAETDGDIECKNWISKVIDAKKEIVAFVSSKREGNPPGEFDAYLKGSFNLALVVKFNDGGPKAVIRFPKPGHTAKNLRDEKVRNEVEVLQLLRNKTTIPVPRVTAWGYTSDSPQRLGPFIIMEYIDGVSLATLLKQPTKTEQDEVILATDIDESKLDFVYGQLADYMLQLSELRFGLIGAITKLQPFDKWIAYGRPLTYNMNELSTVVCNYPTTGFPKTSFTTAKDYLNHLADEHLVHLYTQRNLANSREEAKKRYIARHRFKKLVDRYCLDDSSSYEGRGCYAGPFRLYCDDLQPSNMLADPETLRITAVLDWEFTNAMPAQFAFDPPSWLLFLDRICGSSIILWGSL